jgi:hypothetical protein
MVRSALVFSSGTGSSFWLLVFSLRRSCARLDALEGAARSWILSLCSQLLCPNRFRCLCPLFVWCRRGQGPRCEFLSLPFVSADLVRVVLVIESPDGVVVLVIVPSD